jgi:hypothetical protein
MQRIVVLLKYLILLALLAPFGLVCYVNGRALLDLVLADAASPPAAADAGRLKETGEAAKKLGDSLQEARDTVVSVAERDADGPIEADSPGAKVRAAAARRSADLGNTRRLLEAVPKVDAGADVEELFPDKPFRGHPYKDYLVERNKGNKDANVRLAAEKRAAPALLQRLEEALNELAKGPREDGGLSGNIKTLLGRLEDLHAQARYLSQDNVDWVTGQLAGWKQAQRMLELADEARVKLARNGKAREEDIGKLLDKHRELLKDPGPSDEFKNLVKGMARRCAEHCLPEALPYAEWVLIGPGKGERYDKKNVRVILDRDGEKVQFEKSGYDEFALEKLLDGQRKYPMLYLENLQRTDGGPLKPAPPTLAARAYNDWLKKLKESSWDSDALAAVQKVCAAHEDDLSEVRARLDKLLHAVKGREILFSSGK